MTSTMDRRGERVVTRHPVRGAIWGLLLGLSVAIYAVLFRVIAFGEWLPLGLCVLGGVALGVLWAYVAPPKQTTPAEEDLNGLDDDLTTAAAATTTASMALDDTPPGVQPPTTVDGEDGQDGKDGAAGGDAGDDAGDGDAGGGDAGGGDGDGD